MVDEIDTGKIDYDKGNLYGCVPCPKCGSEYRAPCLNGQVVVINCDDCGDSELATNGTVLEDGHIVLEDEF